MRGGAYRGNGWVILLLGSLLALGPAQAEQRVALVIGNGAYQAAPLRNPPNDAQAISLLLQQCGFQVIERIDCTQQAMEEAIRDFGKQIQRGGVGLFYYAGHGMQVDGRNYLIPVGAEIRAEDEIRFKAVDAGLVLSKMETAGNQVNIVILDACRDNPFARSFRSSSRGLMKMDAPQGTFLAYATGPGDVASDGAGANGLYTSMVLKHMATPGLPLEMVFKRVRAEVVKATGDSQVPWESSSLVGDFFFVPGGSYTPAPAPPAQIVEPRPQPAPTVLPAVFEGIETMVYVPAGEFLMGSTDADVQRYLRMFPGAGKDWFADEQPRHWVFLDAYHLDTYEVTVEQFQSFAAATGRGMPPAPSWGWIDHHPVVNVSWDDAVAFCGWAGKRLPTEAEWEKAARGTNAQTFPWGEGIDASKANCGSGGTKAVGSYPGGVSPYGVHDMAGNVWEWVADWYDSGYYARSVWRNPPGPTSGSSRVLRGGSWDCQMEALRSVSRSSDNRSNKDGVVGFRCARP